MLNSDAYKEMSVLCDVSFDTFTHMVNGDGWHGLEHFDCVVNILLRAQHNKAIGMPDFMIWLHIMTLCGDSNLIKNDNGFLNQKESLDESLVGLLQACEDKNSGIPDFIIWLNLIESSGIVIPWNSK